MLLLEVDVVHLATGGAFLNVASAISEVGGHLALKDDECVHVSVVHLSVSMVYVVHLSVSMVSVVHLSVSMVSLVHLSVSMSMSST